MEQAQNPPHASSLNQKNKVINRIPSASASVGVRGESNTAGSGSSGDTTIVVPVQIGNETVLTICI